jgi:hypothetical protein
MSTPRIEPDRVIAVWPCDHGNVRVEPGPAVKSYPCHECGATASTYVLRDAPTCGQEQKP